MKKTYLLHIIFLLLPCLLILSCQPKEVESKSEILIAETNTLEAEETSANQNYDIRKAFVIYHLDLNSDKQFLYYFAIKTYCKSWDLPLIKIDNFSNDSFPIIHHNDTLAIFETDWTPSEWENGAILLKPQAPPYFLSYTEDNQPSITDEFFGFNLKDKKRPKHIMTTQDYEQEYIAQRFDVNNYYNFQSKIQIMEKHFIDHSKTTSMTNESFIESYLSLKYHLMEENYGLIAHCLIHYPFEFNNQGKVTQIKTPEEFLTQWDDIFSKKILYALRKANYTRLNTENDAVLIGDGKIWLQQSNNRVKITKIDNN